MWRQLDPLSLYTPGPLLLLLTFPLCLVGVHTHRHRLAHMQVYSRQSVATAQSARLAHSSQVQHNLKIKNTNSFFLSF